MCLSSQSLFNASYSLIFTVRGQTWEDNLDKYVNFVVRCHCGRKWDLIGLGK